MTTRTCTQCGQPLSEIAKFCSQCGFVADGPAAAPSNAQAAPSGRTLLSIAQPSPPGPLEPPAPTKAMPAGSHASVAAKRTIVGLPSLAGDAPAAPAPKAAAPASGPPTQPMGPAPAPSPLARNKTMLGVALPGIAPLRAGGEGTDTPAPPGEDPVGPAGTLMRPATPPLAPLGETLPLPVFFVPPPAPLVEPPLPSEPRVQLRRGAPLAVAALVGIGVALLGGLAIVLLWRSAPPITAQPRVAPDGNDVLHLTCEANSCEDGTVVSFHGTKSTFGAGEADLPLSTPLRVGENSLALAIDRPGMGRDETVRLVVPVAYRVRADVTTMQGPHPAITIRVEAPTGTEVRIDDKPVSLDAEGAGAYAIDEAAATEGPADESRAIAIDVPYAVVPRGRPVEKGTVSARIAIAPLRVDAPGASAVIDEGSLLVAGRAAKGANVTVDGVEATPGPDGAFEATVAIPAPGDHTIDVRAGTALLAPRTVRVAVTRVASLADAAKSFEARHPLGYDAAMQDLVAGKTGEPIVVEGDVVDARESGHRTLVLVDDHRGCARGPCLVRIVVGRDLTLAHGESLSAYGSVARAYRTPADQTVPEVEADFVVRAKR
jgi:hypothetical protein